MSYIQSIQNKRVSIGYLLACLAISIFFIYWTY